MSYRQKCIKKARKEAIISIVWRLSIVIPFIALMIVTTPF